MKLLRNIAILSMLALSAQGQEYNVSWIANNGDWEESHVPYDMLNMYVHHDGTVATICNWDEGGTNVGVFKDGKLISRPDASVHNQSGWSDFNYCINAYRKSDGTYIIMNEENAFAKVLVYRMKK